MKKLLAILLSVGILIGTVSLTAFTANLTPEITIEQFTEQLGEMNKEYKDEPVSNRLIVKSKHDIPILDGVDIVEGYDGLHIVQFDNSDSAKKALEYYNDNKLIEYAEADEVVQATETAVTPSYGSSLCSTYGNHLSWGSESVGVDDYIESLTEIETLPEICVGIIDTGIDLDHEFLQDRIIPTDYNISTTGLENCEEDDQGHGTHVAGIIVDNTTENVKIKAYKALNAAGAGTMLNVSLAVKQAVSDGVDTINMSLGSNAESFTLEHSINRAISNSITVCVAAGNDGMDAANKFPANIENCITVSAIDANDSSPVWANWGDIVDIVAPGVSVYSTHMDNSYLSMNGTSMSTPFVTAASALLLTKENSLEPYQISELLTTNGREWCHSEEGSELYGKPALYLGDLYSLSTEERSMPPVFDMPSGRYTESITVTITCEEPDAEIYYTTDGTRATNENGTRYTEPITIDRVTRLNAASYSEGKRKSVQTTAIYYITYLDDESLFEIDSDGTITKYNGSNQYLTVPETINGITATAIGTNAFKGSHMVMLKLPDSVTKICDHSFAGNRNLYSVDASNIETVDDWAFYQCSNLEIFSFEQAISIGNNAFRSCKLLSSVHGNHLLNVGNLAFQGDSNLISVYLPSCKTIGNSTFESNRNLEHITIDNVESLGNYTFRNCNKITEAIMPHLKSMGYRTFYYCQSLSEIDLAEYNSELQNYVFCGCPIRLVNLPEATGLANGVFSSNKVLEIIYMPKVKSVGKSCFFHCVNLKTVFAPVLETTQSLPEADNTIIYVSERFQTAPTNEDMNYHIIAPENSNAQTWANENGYSFTNSDTMVDAIGTHTDKNGNTVFEFGWRNIDDIEQYASTITYGADDSYNVNVIDQSGGNTYFSVPSGNESMCGCVNIDGMIFRSRSLTTGENELEPDNGCEHDWQIVYTVSVPNDTIVVFRCDECDSYYRVSFMDHINTDYPLLDLNHDNIVNAKDLAYIIKGE